jgi:hypothetical protein
MSNFKVTGISATAELQGDRSSGSRSGRQQIRPTGASLAPTFGALLGVWHRPQQRQFLVCPARAVVACRREGAVVLLDGTLTALLSFLARVAA